MKNFFAFKNLDNADAGELSIYDEISFWGVQAKDFAAQLKGVKAKVLNLHINSPGGNVIDGYAIYNMLRASGKEIHVHVDGIAASIASVIAMAGTKILMPENAFMFIHDPLVNFVGGNAEELRKIAVDLDKMKDGILAIYEARTGSDRAKISKLMEEETLMTAKEAKKLGFADEILPELKAQNCAFKLGDFHPTIKLPAVAIQAPVGQTQTNIKMNETEQTAFNNATARVGVLEGENATLKNSVEQARNKAQQDAITAENTRKSAIKAHAAKYNKDGDLNDIVIEALASDTTLDAFKDKVTDAINGRAATGAIKKGAAAGGEDSFEAKYTACKTNAERMALIKANPAEARKLSRS